MKKIIAAALAILLITAALTANVWADDNDETSDDDPLVTYSYLQMFREQLKQEIIEELTKNGDPAVKPDYEEVRAVRGEVIILSRGSEIIFRGGSAVALTSSRRKGDGLTDAASGEEIFSGSALEYGHIYISGGNDTVKAILITGSTADFTVRGGYDRN